MDLGQGQVCIHDPTRRTVHDPLHQHQSPPSGEGYHEGEYGILTLMAGTQRGLGKRNKPEALFGDARDYYEMGHSPETAADDIAAQN
jgi:hypothetical protein